tara:strand:- start:1591 stop:1884 length:294 start_codon:yes stop_codon:yes gene_type:complete
MKRTVDYVGDLAALVRSRGGTGSDYSVAKLLNISGARISNYRRGRYGFDDALAIRAAQILDLSPAEVLANCHAERAKDDAVRLAWEKVAADYRETAA